jgi:hypothetical protein
VDNLVDKWYVWASRGSLRNGVLTLMKASPTAASEKRIIGWIEDVCIYFVNVLLYVSSHHVSTSLFFYIFPTFDR